MNSKEGKMQNSYNHGSKIQFHILTDQQIEELHFATLQILERTGKGNKG